MFAKAFGLNVPLWDQYWHFWDGILHGNLGVSIYDFPAASVIMDAVPYTLALLVPAIPSATSSATGSGRRPPGASRSTTRSFPSATSSRPPPTPGWRWRWRSTWARYTHWFPIEGGYSESIVPNWSWTFVWSLVHHWFLPFLTVFLVSFGGWAIGMRNLVIYELETDYARYLRSLGASERLVRKYAYRNAVLPQLSGLALALGVVVGGSIVTEIVFQYPGLGHLIYEADHRPGLLLAAGHLPVHHPRRAASPTS